MDAPTDVITAELATFNAVLTTHDVPEPDTMVVPAVTPKPDNFMPIASVPNVTDVTVRVVVVEAADVITTEPVPPGQ